MEVKKGPAAEASRIIPRKVAAKANKLLGRKYMMKKRTWSEVEMELEFLSWKLMHCCYIILYYGVFGAKSNRVGGSV